MTPRSVFKRQSFHLIELAVMTGRWVGVAARPSSRAIVLAILLGVTLASLFSPDLQTFGNREAFAAGPAIDHVRASGYLDGYASPGSCDKDQYFQEAFSWDTLVSYVTGTRTVYKSTSTVGSCVEKPRTTRPGVQGGNRWDYWDHYWDRERHKNDPTLYGGWWGW